MSGQLQQLTDIGVSIWLDDLDRARLTSGNLAQLAADDNVVGVTTNPSIFDHSISSGSADYAEQIADLKVRGVDTAEAIRLLTAFDVRWACDVLRPAYERSDGQDGRVSIEVDPRLARQTIATIAEAKALHWLVDRENVLIKIPATVEGLPAITAALAAGVSVNVTLIFSVERYAAVTDAWLAGLEAAQANGHDLSKIHSVASFFISRVDTAVDKIIDGIGTGQAEALRGKAGIANGRLAWGTYQKVMASPRWKALESAGAQPQRPLWASTGVKDPTYSDDRYVVRLAAPGCVNTMPEATLRAVAAHGDVDGDTVSGTQADAQRVFDELTDVGVDLPAVFVQLEDDGVQKFIDAWEDLISHVAAALGGDS